MFHIHIDELSKLKYVFTLKTYKTNYQQHYETGRHITTITQDPRKHLATIPISCSSVSIQLKMITKWRLLQQFTHCLAAMFTPASFVSTKPRLSLTANCQTVCLQSAFDITVTLTFYLLTSKSNLFITVPKCTKVVNLVKFPQAVLSDIVLTNFQYNHECMHVGNLSPYLSWTA